MTTFIMYIEGACRGSLGVSLWDSKPEAAIRSGSRRIGSEPTVASRSGADRYLSAPDLLATVGSLPIRLLPLLMAASGLLSQRLTPSDPRQAPSMYMMNVVMLVFFYNLPSGLVLYWTVMNLLT